MTMNLRANEVERFHANVDRSGDCWVWTGELNNQGYGRFCVSRDGRRVRLLAHRVAFGFASEQSDLPPVVRHSCDNPPCCRPDHLLAGDQVRNMRDALDRGRVDLTGLEQHRAWRSEQVRKRVASGVKSCRSCGETKPFDQFSLSKRNPDGRQYWCKSCMAASRVGLSERHVMRVRRAAGIADEAGAA